MKNEKKDIKSSINEVNSENQDDNKKQLSNRNKAKFQQLNESFDNKSHIPLKNPDENNLNNSLQKIISEPNEEDNLFDIIFKLNHNTNLNILVATINKMLKKEGQKSFNKYDLNIFLSAKELDKFTKAKKVNKNFGMTINYSLVD